MDVSQINGYNSTAKKSSSSGKSAASLSIDQFLSLLAAQLSNQDVLNPTQDTEFVAQMAQFTSLQALENLNQYASYQYGSSLIGKKVSVAKYDTSGKYISDIGIVSQADYSSGDTTVIVNGRSYDLTNIMEVMNDSSYQSYQYAASLVGKKVMVSGYDKDGKVVENTGLVSSCSFASGDAMVVVDGKNYTLSAVRKVISQDASTENDTSEPGSDSSSDSNTDGDKTPASE
ncbi:MAG: flagellar hook capping FlgD N-terminal domain-containing protein [Clostridium sp.]|uniref:flagellar hook capping FlgD N-terminal domain-containing protein n=1 Tax=Clostridium sp. TaxID=1506 RepID=UPI002911FF9B|nr:flagellar hook capping FlgD N-terminal domain-containing protein [Clostridium sp.]MDU7336994.1 flagellar hook capping FlgD N-terminal domain-containing protein [Clostridium sp.]